MTAVALMAAARPDTANGITIDQSNVHLRYWTVGTENTGRLITVWKSLGVI